MKERLVEKDLNKDLIFPFIYSFKGMYNSDQEKRRLALSHFTFVETGQS